MENKFTGLYDENKEPIFVGDKLHNKYGYDVTVVISDGNFYGKLICEDSHPCKDIPYALNGGMDYVKIK